MRIALAQMQMAEDSARNLDTTLEMIRDAKRAGANLILFPERFLPQGENLGGAELLPEGGREVL